MVVAPAAPVDVAPPAIVVAPAAPVVVAPPAIIVAPAAPFVVVSPAIVVAQAAQVVVASAAPVVVPVVVVGSVGAGVGGMQSEHPVQSPQLHLAVQASVCVPQ